MPESTAQTDSLHIHQRFHGPPRSGNGGYVCGITAKPLGHSCSVRLKAPPPLGTALQLEHTKDHARLLHQDTVLAEAKLTTLELTTPVPPSYADAEQASKQFLGFDYHLFPSCFVCGPQRAPGDGLCLFPGPVNNSDLIATPWTPDDSLADETGMIRSEFLWAALDCPGAFVLMPLPDGLGIVLGELSAELVAPAFTHQRYVVCAWPLGKEGKKYFAGTAIYAEDHTLIAKAKATWIEIPLDQWQ